MVPGSTLMYGSNFCSRTLSPRRSSSIPIEAHVRPLPRELTTPPVTKMNLAMRGRSPRTGRIGFRRAGGGGETSRPRHYTGFGPGGDFAAGTTLSAGGQGPVFGHKTLIIRGRVHAPAGVGNDADPDRPPGPQGPELF